MLAWGGVSVVAKATGMSRSTIHAGIKELAEREETSAVADDACSPSRRRTQAVGGNRPGVVHALEAWWNPATRGDPESPLRWTCKSTADWRRN